MVNHYRIKSLVNYACYMCYASLCLRCGFVCFGILDITKGRTHTESSRSVRCLGKQWQALPSPVQCEETATQTRNLPVTCGKTLLLAPGPPFIAIHSTAGK